MQHKLHTTHPIPALETLSKNALVAMVLNLPAGEQVALSRRIHEVHRQNRRAELQEELDYLNENSY